MKKRETNKEEIKENETILQEKNKNEKIEKKEVLPYFRSLLVIICFLCLYVFIQRGIASLLRDKKELIVEALSNNALIIDVREEAQYKRNHIEGSLNIPISKLKNMKKLLPENKEDYIITYCVSGSKALGAQKMLKGTDGYKNVFNGGSLGRLNGIIKEFEQKGKE